MSNRTPPRSSAVKFHTDDRVTVTDTTDRWYSEVGHVEDFYYGMTGRVLYLVKLDVREDTLPFTADQLTLGERVFTE